MLEIMVMNSILLTMKNWYLRLWSVSFIIFFSLFLLNTNFNVSDINFYLQKSNISMILVSLTILISFLMILCSTKPNYKPNLMSFFIILLNLNLILVFSVSSMFMMYFFFEFSLIPTLILILGWGYQPERIQAGMYLILYTFMASMPLFFVLLFLYSNFFNSHMLSMSMYFHSQYNTMIFIMTMLAFLVKLPIYLSHLWLPKAHVEAPLAGSMILAGILLKLGGYGIYQVYFMFSFDMMYLSYLIITLSLWGGLITMFVCYRQNDMKSLIAYSSIGHMSVMLAGLMIFLTWGVKGAIFMMVAHGLCSSALFTLASFNYEKVNSRNMPLIKGMLAFIPSLTFWWFLFCTINMACPPSLNLLSEIMIFPSIFFFSFFLILPMSFMTFMSAVYNMYLYSSINHGMPTKIINPFNGMKSYMNLGLFLHLFPYFLIMKIILF
uniref:NADH-ubiquinone oxidoreductase chain 4 n=1 Tax=Valvata hokkaidoensis TaxID=96458 RepID=A0A7R7T1U8_9GAST|nr:ND4 [Valvata hokkaidoensis]